MIIELLSGAISGAIVSGFFNLVNNNLMWQQNNLLQDKNQLRKIINRLNSEYLDNLNTRKFNLENNSEILDRINLMIMYLDPHNPCSSKLAELYQQLVKLRAELSSEFEDIKDHLSEDEIVFSEYPTFIKKNDEMVQNLNEIKPSIHKYFAYYYPQPNSLVKKIRIFLHLG